MPQQHPESQEYPKSGVKDYLDVLWVGNVEYATDYLLHLDSSLVKIREWLEKLVQYLDKPSNKKKPR